MMSILSIEIPAGSFLMGSNSASDTDAAEHEQPQHSVNLYRYYIARYPVTVAQFRAFVEESGYKPTMTDSLRALPNYPVVWVSWHDAVAYCAWLTDRLREWSKTPEPLAHMLRQQGGCVTLPSEAEWEKVANAIYFGQISAATR